MPVLTDLASAEVKRDVRILYGQIATTPALLVSDGISLQYACDVNIGPTDPTGLIDQYKDRYTGHTTSVTHLPGEEDYVLGDEQYINTVLHNCLIDKANDKLRWAEVGSPVKLERTPSGIWRITDFALEMPGTFTVTPVNLGDLTIGETVDLSTTVRRLTLLELGTIKPFGSIKLGASGVFLGSQLQKLVS